MPPKSKTTPPPEEEPTLLDLYRLVKSNSDQGKSNGEQLSTLKILVEALTEENKQLRESIKLKDKQLEDMQEAVNGLEQRLNSLEQHHRGWSARVLNIPLTEAEEQDPDAVIEKVYTRALLPILEGAALKGKLKEIPMADQVLEVAHILPGKAGQPKPIIMRFYNRNLRNLIFAHKRDFAPRDAAEGAAGRGGQRSGGGRGGQASGSERPGRFSYPLYDDLTKLNLNKMRAIQQDERVQACWSVNGQIRFKLHDSNVVQKVLSIHDPLDKILVKK
jgi:hypothetical protein